MSYYLTAYENTVNYSPDTSAENDAKYGIYMVHIGPKAPTVIQRRDSSNRLMIGDDFRTILPLESVGIFFEHLRSYETSPLLLKTHIGSAIIFMDIFSSTSTFIAVFLDAEKKGRLIPLLTRSENASHLIYSEKALTRYIPKRDVKLVEDFKIMLNNIMRALNISRFRFNCAEESCVEKTYNLIKAIADIVSCPLTVFHRDELICDDRFDEQAFAAYILGMLMLCKKESRKGVAVISLSSQNGGIAAEISFDTKQKLYRMTSPMIEALAVFSENNNMLFEFASDEGSLKAKLLPIRLDWSFLELKSDQKFDWDN